MKTGATLQLPEWALVSAKRRAHIERVTALLDEWSRRLRLGTAERTAWHDAGICHDALRDAPEAMLRELAGNPPGYAVEMLHGPAAAEYLVRAGESRANVLAAIRHHTVGCSEWDAVGRALYMADYLDPGRKFSPTDRAYLASRVPDDFDGTFRQVVRARLEWSLREGMRLYPESIQLWNAIR